MEEEEGDVFGMFFGGAQNVSMVWARVEVV